MIEGRPADRLWSGASFGRLVPNHAKYGESLRLRLHYTAAKQRTLPSDHKPELGNL